MSGSPASAFAEGKSQRVLVMGLNWVGDTIMSLPALQLRRRRHPEDRVRVLARPTVAGLWQLSPAVDEVVEFPRGIAALLAAVRIIRGWRPDIAFVLPHSIRSALPPFLAGVPRRYGLPGPLRSVLLTEVTSAAERAPSRHQAFEYVRLMAPWALDQDLPDPKLEVPESARRRALSLLPEDDRPWLALMPGAARGPAKQWPAERFAEVARRLHKAKGVRVVVLGSPAERELCESVASACGACARSLAGRLDLAEWVAVVARCRLAVGNDSGGMHVAAAVGVPVVVIFGLTDAACTAPLARRFRWVQAPVALRSRDIARRDPRARSALEAIGSEEVYRAAIELLEEIEA